MVKVFFSHFAWNKLKTTHCFICQVSHFDPNSGVEACEECQASSKFCRKKDFASPPPSSPTSPPSTTATTYPVIQQWPAKDCQTIFQKDELTHLHYVFFRWFMEDLQEKTRFAFKGLFRFFFPFSFTPQPKILFVVISCNPRPSSISCFCLRRYFPNSARIFCRV